MSDKIGREGRRKEYIELLLVFDIKGEFVCQNLQSLQLVEFIFFENRLSMKPKLVKQKVEFIQRGQIELN